MNLTRQRKPTQRQVNRAWKKVIRLGSFYIEISRKHQALLENVIEAVRQANELEKSL